MRDAGTALKSDDRRFVLADVEREQVTQRVVGSNLSRQQGVDWPRRVEI